MATKKFPWSMVKDDKADKKAGIKENTSKDKALDKKRGVPEVAVKTKPKKK
jgi:hypothetical protein